MADEPDAKRVKQEHVWVLYHAGNSVVLAVYSSEAKAVAALKAGKAEYPEYNFNPSDNDVLVYKTPLDELASIGCSGKTKAEIVLVDIE
jgi:ActR/RegA family two-component response regulator